VALEIRGIGEAELRPWIDAVQAAFGEVITDEQFNQARKVFEVERVVAAFDDGGCVGGGAAFSYRLSVPGGGEVGAAGVTAVGVMPTHRRRGILRQVMARQLADVRAAGEPVAILWASEGIIYQRFGYGLASLNGAFDLPRAKAAFRQSSEWAGSVRLIDRATAMTAFPPVYEAAMRQTPGFFGRHRAWWEDVLADPEYRRRGASQKFFALYERGGQPAGYAIYRVKHDWSQADSRNEVRVLEALAVDPAAERDVWRYLFSIDLIDHIVLRLGPPDQPLLLSLAQPEVLGLKVGDGLWLRVVDVPAALTARGYAADGELVLEINDEFMPDVGGRWRLRVADGQATVEPTTEPAELGLDVNDLGSVYLGGFRFADLARAGRTSELVAGARARADSLFANDRAPWCPQIF
jgi:predicted acetyltransferase